MVYGSFALVLSGVLYLLAAVLRRTDYRLLRDTEPFDESLESGQVRLPCALSDALFFATFGNTARSRLKFQRHVPHETDSHQQVLPTLHTELGYKPPPPPPPPRGFPPAFLWAGFRCPRIQTLR